MSNDTITFTTSPKETQTITLLPGSSVSLIGHDGAELVVKSPSIPEHPLDPIRVSSLYDTIATLEDRLARVVKERDEANQRADKLRNEYRSLMDEVSSLRRLKASLLDFVEKHT